MKITEIMREIDDSLSPEALEYWNGCADDLTNEICILAQRQCVADAVEEVELLAKG